MTEKLSSPPHQSPAQAKLEKDAFQFEKSIKELKDLRSQLHYAADYCESSFLNSDKKDQVMENTKEYICRAVITVVDHLGSASANFDKVVSQDKTVTEAELRLDSLGQRLLACKQFSQQSALADLHWNLHLSRHRSRYLLAELPNNDKSRSNTDDAKVAFDNESEVKRSEPLDGGMDSSKVKSDDAVLIWPKAKDTAFEFQKTRKPRRSKLVRVSFHHSIVLLSLVSRGARRKSGVN